MTLPWICAAYAVLGAMLVVIVWAVEATDRSADQKLSTTRVGAWFVFLAWPALLLVLAFVLLVVPAKVTRR